MKHMLHRTMSFYVMLFGFIIVAIHLISSISAFIIFDAIQAQLYSAFIIKSLCGEFMNIANKNDFPLFV
jgi:hypothetical protein